MINVLIEKILTRCGIGGLWIGLDHPSSSLPLAGWYKMQGNMLSVYVWRFTVTVLAEWLRKHGPR